MLSAEQEFVAYGLSHWLAIVVFVVGAVLLVLAGRRHPDAASARRFSRIFAGVIFALFLVVFINDLIPLSIDRSVPLQISNLICLTAAYALWSHRQWAYALTYYWGLVLSTQALASPVLTGPDFPHIEFLGFWAIHLVVIWAAIYLTWGRGLRPDWRSYWTTVGVTVTWAAVTMTFNAIADTNYGFLNRKPGTATLLDYLGPWPWYLIPVAVLALTAWALLTWPWERTTRKTADSASAG